jgi:hypothetical protein
MAELHDLSTLAAANTGRFPNGMQVEQLNDAARELEAMIARHYKDTSGQLATQGNGAAYTITPNRTISTLAAGILFVVRAHVPNTGEATLQIGATSAKPLVRQNGDALQAGDIVLHQKLVITYTESLDKHVCIGIGDPSLTSTAMPRFTVANLPAVSDMRAIVVTDESGGAVQAYSDGTNWRRVTDRAIVS